MLWLDLLAEHVVLDRPVEEIFALACVRLTGVVISLQAVLHCALALILGWAAEFAVELVLDRRFELALLTVWVVGLVLSPQAVA